MNSIIMKNKEAVDKWKKKYENNTESKISFIPLDSIPRHKLKENKKLDLPDIDYEGYIGIYFY
jgi:hypothetical protein